MTRYTNTLLEYGLSTLPHSRRYGNAETHSLNRIAVAPSFYIRYIDDIALALDNSYINKTLHIFNSYHSRLKFTIKLGGELLNFLNVMLILY